MLKEAWKRNYLLPTIPKEIHDLDPGTIFVGIDGNGGLRLIGKKRVTRNVCHYYQSLRLPLIAMLMILLQSK